VKTSPDFPSPVKEKKRTKLHLQVANYQSVRSEGEGESYTLFRTFPLLVWQSTDLGFKMIIDNAYPGLAYRSQVFRPLHVGERLRGYIMGVRPDGKIEISLQPLGRKQTTDFAEQLLQYLKDNKGYCNLRDKSEAEDIKRLSSAPGIGKKTAERMVLELRGKLVSHTAADGLFTAAPAADETDDIVNTLIALGYNEREAKAAIKGIPKGTEVGEGVRLALKNLLK